MVETHAVDQWLQVSQKEYPAFVFQKLFQTLSVNTVIVLRKFFNG
jgi:hypothetical protein